MVEDMRPRQDNADDLSRKLEEFDKRMTFDISERLTAELLVVGSTKSTRPSSKTNPDPDAGFLADSDGEGIQNSTHTEHSESQNNERALEALMSTPRKSCKKSAIPPGGGGARTPLRQGKRSLLKGFKLEMKSARKVDDEIVKTKAEDILLSLSTPKAGPKAKKSCSKHMSDELWKTVMCDAKSIHSPLGKRAKEDHPKRSPIVNPNLAQLEPTALDRRIQRHGLNKTNGLNKTTSHLPSLHVKGRPTIQKANSNHSLGDKKEKVSLGRSGSCHELRAKTGDFGSQHHGRRRIPRMHSSTSLGSRRRLRKTDSNRSMGRSSKENQDLVKRSIDAALVVTSEDILSLAVTDPTLPQTALQPLPLDKRPDSPRRVSNEPRKKVSRRVLKNDSGAKRVVVDKQSRPTRDSSVGPVRVGRRSSRQQARQVANSLQRSNSTSKLETTGRSKQGDIISPPSRRGSKTAGKRRSYQRQKSSSSAIGKVGDQSKE
ncbi:unnamed protein product [Cylindrotheca closterium]|uniref:Uncharacterized protein n=1 Tax=Cylindrotheca closterium TaxID=2856 RepID=A0AAD2FL41_9STRA|nr:unnamed protein product [Cylindrotheca closterium]